MKKIFLLIIPTLLIVSCAPQPIINVKLKNYFPPQNSNTTIVRYYNAKDVPIESEVIGKLNMTCIASLNIKKTLRDCDTARLFSIIEDTVRKVGGNAILITKQSNIFTNPFPFYNSRNYGNFANNIDAKILNVFDFSSPSKYQLTVKDNMKVAVYIHPFSLAFSTMLTALAVSHGAMVVAGWFYCTIEKPLNLYSSLIVKPSLWNEFIFNLNNLDDYEADIRGIRIGSDVGIRFYPNRKGEGLYLQAQGGIFNVNIYDTKSYVGKDVMGYFGFSYKSNYRGNIFFEIGAGWGNTSGERKNTVIFDINFGVNFKFLQSIN